MHMHIPHLTSFFSLVVKWELNNMNLKGLKLRPSSLPALSKY